MDHSRRHLLRATLFVAAAPRVRAQQPTPPVMTTLTAAAGTCSLDDTFVDHAGWIIPREARAALLDGPDAPDQARERLPRPPRVEAGEAGADSSGTQVIRGR